jgi:TolB-like protein/DNA-binding winged helix-turn-helix (wHTH) protein/Tfp pilus assembly protein PilF
VVPSSLVSGPNVICFGRFELDVRERVLRKEGQRVRLQDQPFQILCVFLQRPGELVTREELRNELWPAGTFVDFEHSVNTAVKKLRQALNDTAEDSRYIETIPRQGYRFIAPVRQPEGPPASPGQETPRSLEEAAPEVPLEAPLIIRPARRVPLSAALIGLTCLCVVLFALLWKSNTARPRISGIQSLAVLPLVNLSGDPGQEYFADGMTEALITELAKAGPLRLISRTSVMQFKGARMALPDIAKALHVDAIVEGSVVRSGDRVRVTAQLIQAASDRHLWANTYESQLGNLLELQDRIARTIAHEVGVKLTGEQLARLTGASGVNWEAYENYLQGRYYWNKRTEEGETKGLEYFERASRKDPNFAPAYAGIADSYIVLAHHGHVSANDAYRNAKTAALKANQLDGTSAEAHTSLGLVAHAFEWNWPAAEREFKAAIQLNPNYATAHHWYSHYLVSMGKLDEAIRELRQARDLDPLSFPINIFLGMTLFYSHQEAAALAQFHNTEIILPGYAEVHGHIANVYEQEKRFDEAVTEKEQALVLAHKSAAALKQAYATSGYPGVLREELKHWNQEAEIGVPPDLERAHLYTRLGERDRAFLFLEKAYEQRDPWLLNLKVDPAWETIRTDGRFQDLVRRIGLP